MNFRKLMCPSKNLWDDEIVLPPESEHEMPRWQLFPDFPSEPFPTFFMVPPGINDDPVPVE